MKCPRALCALILAATLAVPQVVLARTVAAAPAASGVVLATFPAGSGKSSLGVTAGAEDAPPVGPLGIIDGAHGGLLILDNVNARIVRVTAGGKVQAVTPIAATDGAQDIVRHGTSVYVLGTAPVYVGEDDGIGSIGAQSLESSASSTEAASSMFEANGAVLTDSGGIL